ncbi:MAG: hypothetical protein R2706_04415 [Acidimicrobiales bacterium]
MRDIGIRSAIFTRGFMIMLGLLGAIGTALVYGLGGLFAINGGITAGALATMGLLVGRIYQPLTGLTNARIDVLTALVSFDRVFEVLDSPIPLADKDDAIDLANPRGTIEFDDVTFRYPSRPRPSSPRSRHQAQRCRTRTRRRRFETSASRSNPANW